MNKKILLVLALFTAGAMFQQAEAAGKKKKNGRYNDMHLVSMWGGVGYSGMLHGAYQPASYYGADVNTKFVGGGGGLLGVGYEYRFKKFMLSVGPEFRIFSSQDNLNFSKPMSVTDLAAGMTLYYQMDKAYETQAVGQLMVPVLFGGNFGRYYFLAGAKVGYTILHKWSMNGKITTYVVDEKAYDPWQGIGAHDLVTKRLSQHPLANGLKGSNPFGLDMTLSAEFGVNINTFLSEEWNTANMEREHPNHFRAGVFVDYGLPLFDVKAEQKLLTVAGTQYNPAVASLSGGITDANSVHRSEMAKGKLNSLLVGVKGTYIMQLNKPKGHKPLTPQLAVTIKDEATGKPIPNAYVLVQNLETNSKGKMKAPKRLSSGSKGAVVKPFKEGEYDILIDPVWAAQNSYYVTEEDTIHSMRMVEPPMPRTKKEKPEPQRVSFSLTKIPTWTVTVKDKRSKKPIAAHVQIFADEENILDTVLVTSAEDGQAKLTFPRKECLSHRYTVKVGADHYISEEGMISDLYGQDTYLLKPVKRTFLLKNMYFATAQTTILPQSEPDLQMLYEFLTENPNARILIIGHTDSVGKDRDNQILSEGRSASVKEEMVRRGIAAERMETDGKGESEPIDTNETDEGRQNNRRVEIQILSE